MSRLTSLLQHTEESLIVEQHKVDDLHSRLASSSSSSSSSSSPLASSLSNSARPRTLPRGGDGDFDSSARFEGATDPSSTAKADGNGSANIDDNDDSVEGDESRAAAAFDAAFASDEVANEPLRLSGARPWVSECGQY